MLRPQWQRPLEQSAALIVFALMILAHTSVANAVDLFAYGGMLDRAPIRGCCKKVEPNFGFGLVSRIEKVGTAGDLEIGGFTDYKWSEMTIGKYQYLIGNSPQTDPVSSKDMVVRRLSDFSLSWSYGIGFFSHNTRKEQFDLPVLSVGGLIYTRLLPVWNINDTWSVGGVAEFAVGMSTLDMVFNIGWGLGAGYRF